MPSDQDSYHELLYYTLSHPDPSFIHQHVVDAYAAQNADENSKPIGIVFSLVGLYLHVEKNFTGKQVQHVHMRLGAKRKTWPRLIMPKERGNLTARDVAAAPTGIERDTMIHRWCAVVWETWKESREQIVELLAGEFDIR